MSAQESPTAILGVVGDPVGVPGPPSADQPAHLHHTPRSRRRAQRTQAQPPKSAAKASVLGSGIAEPVSTGATGAGMPVGVRRYSLITPRIGPSRHDLTSIVDEDG